MNVNRMPQEHWPLINYLDSGKSTEAQELQIWSKIDESTNSPSYSDLNYSLLLEALSQAVLEASSVGWDGHGAFQANPSSIAYTLQFINHLKPYLPFPEIAIDQDGEVALEWGSGPRNQLSLRIGSGGTIHFAALQGYDAIYGTTYYIDQIPEDVAHSMRRTFEAFPK